MALKLWDEEEVDFQLLGIQSKGMEEHKFVYWLNKTLGFQFSRTQDLDITFGHDRFCFSLYQYDDVYTDIEYFLIKNRSHNNKTENPNSLFDSVEDSRFLLSKHKIFDYLLKINTNSEDVQLIQLSLVKSIFVQHVNLIENLNKNEKTSLLI